MTSLMEHLLLLLLSLLAVAAAQLTGAAAAAAAPQCVAQLSSCSCQLADGQVIDLSPLQASPGPAFNYKAQDQYTYQFNPCGSYRCGTESDAAVCQEKVVIIQQYVDFGVQTSAQFDTDQATGTLRLRYLSRDAAKSTVLSLVCDPAASDASFSTQGVQGAHLNAELKSRFACPVRPAPAGGMSPGDVLLLVCFILLAAYLLAGVLINRFIRQRSGGPRELLPNVDFWAGLPGLVADGAAFVYLAARRLVCADKAGYADVK